MADQLLRALLQNMGNDAGLPGRQDAGSGRVGAELALLSALVGAKKHAAKAAKTDWPVHRAIKRDADDEAVMTLLRERPDRIAERNRKGRTPLYMATRTRRRELVLRMLAEGADPLLPAEDGYTAVHLASLGRESAMVRDLVDAVIARQQIDGGGGGGGGSSSNVRAILSARVSTSNGYTLAHIAASKGDVSTLRLIDRLWPGGEPFAVPSSDQGLTPLHVAARWSTEATAFLLSVVPRDAVDRHAPGMGTALHMASQGGSKTRVALLLGAGADPNAEPPADGRFPLVLMALANKLQAVCTLLEHGARVDARSVDGFTALHLTALNDNQAVAHALLRAGADTTLRTPSVPTPHDAKDTTDEERGRTAAELAALRGHHRVVRLISHYAAKRATS